MNFTIGDSVIKPEAKFKGGTWRDRLTAKKRSLVDVAAVVDHHQSAGRSGG
jgi:hypothetical protein